MLRRCLFALFLFVGATGLLTACDSTGVDEDCNPSGSATFQMDIGTPFDRSFSTDQAYQAVLSVEGGRYAQVFVAPSEDDTTAFLLGYGQQQSTALAPGTYQIRDVEAVEESNPDRHDGFVGLLRSEHLVGLGYSLGGSVEIDRQCDGVASGSFTATTEIHSFTADSARTDTATVTGEFTVQEDSAAVRAFIPFDRVIEIDPTDV